MRRRLPHAPTLALCLAAALLTASPAAAGGHGKEEKGAPVTYFALEPLTATTVRADGRRGVMTLETGIESKDPKLMERAQASTPRLRAAFAQVLMTYAAGMRRGTPPDVDYLGTKLQATADQVLGRKGVRVLLGTAMIN